MSVLCQLPVNYIVDFKTQNFYAGLSTLCSSPANMLFKWFGHSERVDLNLPKIWYIVGTAGIYKYKVHSAFNNYTSTLM
jgi:hypothetical protein